MCEFICARACVVMRVRAFVCAHVCVCMRKEWVSECVCLCVFASACDVCCVGAWCVCARVICIPGICWPWGAL